MSYPSGITSTNILAKLELNRQTESLMKQYLVANDQTSLSAAYATLISDLTADKAVVDAADNVDTLFQ